MFGISVLLALLPSNNNLQKVLGLEDLVKLQTASTAAVRSLEVHLEIADNIPSDEGRPGVGPMSKQEKHYSVDWAFDGDWEYIKVHDFRDVDRRGRVFASVTEEENVPSGYRIFARSNPEKPLDISESNDGGVQANVAGRRKGPIPFRMKIRAHMHMLFFYDGQQERTFLPFPDLLNRAKNRSVLKTPGSSSLACYEVVAETPINQFTIFLDPKHNFWATRFEQRPTQSDMFAFAEIQEFEEFSNGIYLPKLRIRKESVKSANYEETFRFSYPSVNQPIDQSKYHVAFPEWTRVFDSDKKLIHLWGSDDKPKQTFASLQEYQNWFSSRRNPTVLGDVIAEGLKEESTWWRSSWTWLAIGSVVVLTGALLLRWRRGRPSAR